MHHMKNIGNASLAGTILFLVSTFAGAAAAQTCIEPPPDLIAWWPGDGSAEDIVGGRDGALENGAGFGAGQVGQAFDLDGGDDFVRTAAFTFPTDLTIAAWIRPDRLAKEMILVTAPSISPPFGQSGLFLFSGPPGPQLRFMVDSDRGNRGYWYTVFPFTVGQWHHVAVTQSGAASLPTLYVDGIASPVVVDLFGGTPYRVGAPLAVGRQGGFNDGYFQGALDEVQLWNRALTAAEIRAIYDAGSAGLCRALAVQIDVKPGSFRNSVNPRSRGVIPVAVLTQEGFDATTVDPATVLFGATASEAVPGHSSAEDVDGDGDLDLVLHFDTRTTGIGCGDTSASLTGETFSGQIVEGSDSIRTVGCK